MRNLLVQLQLGDCITSMKALPDCSVGAMVTDPPYGLEFMGSDWDKLVPSANSNIGKMSNGGFDIRSGGPFQGNPNYSASANLRCKTCGKWIWSQPASKCNCEIPDLPNFKAAQGALMQEWHEEWLREALRVLKPGGIAKVFSGSRTFHRLARAMANVGFEMQRIEAWIYQSGFPKSHSVSRAIDQHLGAERDKVVVQGRGAGRNPAVINGGRGIEGGDRPWMMKAREQGFHEKAGKVAVTPEAKAWDGWETALKPAWEPFLVGRKPCI